MKPKILKFSTLALLLLFIGASCQKDDIEYADESIVVNNSPDISIYKTNGDYYNFITITITPKGIISAIPDYTIGDKRIRVENNGEISPNTRWHLKSGYIVDKESHIDKVFTDITYQEYINYNITNNVRSMPTDLIESRIINRDPFIEFYNISGINKPYKEFTLGELNKMIENGTIEEHFIKLK